MKTTANGISVNYTLDGPASAPVVTLSHSLAADLAMWDPQMKALTATYRVLRYDTRGHGGTDRAGGRLHARAARRGRPGAAAHARGHEDALDRPLDGRDDRPDAGVEPARPVPEPGSVRHLEPRAGRGQADLAGTDRDGRDAGNGAAGRADHRPLVHRPVPRAAPGRGRSRPHADPHDQSSRLRRLLPRHLGGST